MKRSFPSSTIVAVTVITASTVVLVNAALAEPRGAKTTSSLAAQIVMARRDAPQDFRKLDKLRDRMPVLDKNKRGRLARVSPLLRAFGAEALLPMLDELTTPRRHAFLNDKARKAWRMGLLEALADLRDPRSALVVRNLIDQESDPGVLQAAVAALGTLGDDESVEFLLKRCAVADSRQPAILAGMGRCRRVAAARAVATQLEAHPRDDQAMVLAKALGEMGNAWAWETPPLKQMRDESVAVRRTAVEALLGAFINYQGATREAAETAILLVDFPGTLELIEAAKRGASDQVRAKLEGLGDRCKNNPLHPRPL